jgi:2-iminobutanoate/2-iminopropanoate deaminase
MIGTDAFTRLCFATLFGPTLFLFLERSNAMKKEIKTQDAPLALGPFSQAIEIEGMIFVSGQIAMDPVSGEFQAGTIEEQTCLTLSNLKAVIDAAGSSLDKVTKCTVLLQDLKDYAAVNAVYREFFSSPYPARIAVQVARLPLDAKIEIDAIAIKE